MLRIIVASVALVAITIVLLLHATHHGAHANSPTHCGFWTEIEAGLLGRGRPQKAAICGFPLPHRPGEAPHGGEASPTYDWVNRKIFSKKYTSQLQRLPPRTRDDTLR